MAGPERTCLGCRRRAPQATLVRVVARGHGVAVDPGRVLPGRGAYLHPEAGCVDRAVKRRAFARALRAEVDAAGAGRVLADFLGTATSA